MSNELIVKSDNTVVIKPNDKQSECINNTKNGQYLV